MPERGPIKVVHLITLLEFGGAQGNTIHTVQHLDKERFETYLWAGQGAYWDGKVEALQALKGRLRYFPRLVRNLNPIYDLLVTFQLWLALRKLQPAILHTHSSKAGIVGRIAGWLAGVPIIIHTFHGFGFNDEQMPWTRWFFIYLEKLTAVISTKLVFVSRSNVEVAQALGIGKTEQYTLIRSGVPIQKIKERGNAVDRTAVRSSLGIPPESPLVTTIGPFKPQKNLSDFVSVAGEVSAKSHDVHFLIVGDGAARKELEAQVARTGIQNVFHMPGWREDAADILAASDIFVMTSLWEGLPRSLVEAMILGVPPVCYDTDGVKDLLSREDGTIVAQRAVEDLAAQILRILKDDQRKKALSQSVRQRIGPEFDIDEMVTEQEKLYENLLGARRER